MIMQFPTAHNDELLVSILARFVARQGLRNDKAALELLFGTRNIVPSALLQGHIQPLLSNVGHLWPVSETDVIIRHSLLPFFQSFIEPQRIEAVQNSLIYSEKSTAMTAIGKNASNVHWPIYYRYCPKCIVEDNNLLAYSYWRRSFQLPGLVVCPRHLVYLQSSHFKLLPSRRHGFCDASQVSNLDKLIHIDVDPNNKLLKLAIHLQQLLQINTPYVSPLQWTIFYQKAIRNIGLVSGARPDHLKVKERVISYWGIKFLSSYGLGLHNENNWLLAFFRKHRRHYTALHHIACMMALFPFQSILEAIKEASLIIPEKQQRKVYFNSKLVDKVDEYRTNWLQVYSQFNSLKSIRETREGARLYSWLFRYDNVWLQKHLPKRIYNNKRKINWSKRDKELVKELISIRNKSYDNLSLPRMTQTWFIAQVGFTWGVTSHLKKLPLSKCFFIKYTESIDEYQIRRVLAIIINYINKNEPLPRPYEIERLAGLSKQRSRKPVKCILEMDFEVFSCFQVHSRKC